MIEDHKRKGFLFPPIIKRMILDERHMSPFMQERYIEENKKPHGETVVQVCKHNISKLTRSSDVSWQTNFHHDTLGGILPFTWNENHEYHQIRTV